MAKETAELRLAATLVLVQDSEQGPEVLLLKRNPESSFLPAHWVFPGGAVEEKDGLTDEAVSDDVFRKCAVRETFEECGVEVRETALVLLSRWIAPAITPKRFDTTFYLASSKGDDVAIDGSEIVDHQWLPAAKAIESHHNGTIKIMPPTLVTLTQISRFESVNNLLAWADNRPLQLFEPRAVMKDNVMIMLYEGDSGYQSGNTEADGPKHRCQLSEQCWNYEC
ncbi:NUDIX hydrolase [Endozoicomonas sp. OPT23]|uniref:NUDIX hydrolase n=1 Tax=Endozoicomonas sp. OPT23 TaxID=2072845 RepID=UPI00129A6620|nr:NUDIX hydrolase [Endozoicomonas sp. OPT23]MRI32722.1 NUDIX hydrolase [Endozoicomonas sp. OPT23]